MKIEIFMATLLMALILTNLIAKKGSLGALVGLGGGVLVGAIAGVIVNLIDGFFGSLNIPLLLLLEFSILSRSE
jgi:hypothetical protein